MSKNFIIALVGGIIFLIVFSYVIFSMGPATKDVTSTATPTASASKKLATVDKLKIEDLQEGTGEEVKEGDTVVINYVGTLTDGTKFDSSYDRNTPFETKIGVGEVIKGWDQGVVGMKVGGKRKLTIPADLGYGQQSQGPIPPNATLVFELELLEIK